MVPFDDIVWEQGQKASRHIICDNGPLKTTYLAFRPKQLTFYPKCELVCPNKCVLGQVSVLPHKANFLAQQVIDWPNMSVVLPTMSTVWRKMSTV